MPAEALTKLGPCRVLFGPVGAETELGKTKGVTWRLTQSAAPILYDQTGTGPFDKITTGKETEVECNFASLDYDLWEDLLIHEATQYQGAPTPEVGTGNADRALDIWLGLGTSHRDHSQRLILQPYIDGAPSLNVEDWVHFPLAFPRPEIEQIYDAETQRVLHVIFEVFPVSQTVPRICFMGDESLIPVAPVVTGP